MSTSHSKFLMNIRNDYIVLLTKEKLCAMALNFYYRHDLYGSIDEISFAARNAGHQKYADGNPLRRGLKLHAWKISLVNPLSQEAMSFCAPIPDHMLQLIEYARMTSYAHGTT